MEEKFYNRILELKELKKKYDNLNYAELCIIYGRRRLGKTSFIKQFLNQISCKKVYYFVNNTNKNELLNLLSDNIYAQTNERYLFSDWEDFFNYLNEQSKNKFVFVMDEFPRLKESSEEFITKFQDYWDSNLKNSKLMFIAIGSSMSMMYDIFLDKNAALYGRLTSKLYFKPFRYCDFREMFFDISEEKKVELFSVFGGTPYFLSYVKRNKNLKLIDLISKLVLSNTSPLNEEPVNFITSEFKKENNYNSILYSITNTNTTRKEILDKTLINPKSIDYYLNNLIDLLGIIKKENPIFFNKKNEIKYSFTDNYFNFWYKFVYPNKSLIELNNLSYLIKILENDINSFIGYRFEDIIKELLILYNGKKLKNLEINFDEIGVWWNKNEEIDIVLNNKRTKSTIVCEVKWSTKEISLKYIKDLERKSKLLNLKGRINYIFVSRKGFDKNCISYMDEKNIIYLDLKDIENLFNNKN
jgi:uncharacterized protein